MTLLDEGVSAAIAVRSASSGCLPARDVVVEEDRAETVACISVFTSAIADWTFVAAIVPVGTKPMLLAKVKSCESNNMLQFAMSSA